MGTGPHPALHHEAAAPRETRPRSEDLELVSALLARDRKAAAEFVSRYTDRVYDYICARLLPRKDLAEDLVQEVFLLAWEHLSEFRGRGSLEAWLLGIARHKVGDHYRERLHKLISLDEESEKAPESAVLPEWDENLDQERLRERTMRAMAKLPEHYRLALLWRYWEKSSAQEMAARTGKSEKAVERLLARARNQFRREWQNA
ncbi:MAG TPA: RNA polymerase sigma factor [Terriglobia bacterium]|nr:RNA polymerase sigma factor [Terriglobia bacterium]